MLCLFFPEDFKKELEEDIKSDTSGDFRAALLALCKVCEQLHLLWFLYMPTSNRKMHSTNLICQTTIAVSYCDIS